jgi:pimeloyl-ACP methyl ester carboxylesterase
MSSMPETRYAKTGDNHVAYQVMGEGPFDLVFVPGFVSHLDLQMEWPLPANFCNRLASFCRLIRFDKRGTGLSDRTGPIPTIDAKWVLDAEGFDGPLNKPGEAYH